MLITAGSGAIMNRDNSSISPNTRFSRLLVLDVSHRDKRWRCHYRVQCDCGTIKTVQGSLLLSGNTRSCGCLARESRKAKALPEHQGVVNQIILQYKRHARNRSIAFQLSTSQVDVLVRQPCHYCGALGGNLKKTKNCKEGFRHNGIDRVDSARGYTLDNSVPCCGTCNRRKGVATKREFLDWVKQVFLYTEAMAEQWGGETNDK